ncbi:MAG: PA0069 family radical SAM protein, partial [Chitinophagales bacterium]
MNKDNYIKGRGAQFNPHNRFEQLELCREHEEGIDLDPEYDTYATQVYVEHPKKIVNKVPSKDISLDYSMNPYQGCEHGCIYCYARNTHEYWGFSAGKDFESKIIVKENAVELLRKFLSRKKHIPKPIMLSGNTDCYQPLEKKYKLTRGLLQCLDEFRHPVGIITKNALVRRDIDVLQSLAKDDLVKVNISLTTLSNELHNKLEPRTASPTLRLKTIKELSNAGIPVGIMCAPVIPGLNDNEIPKILEAAAANGAESAGYTMLRLNGAVAGLFSDWIKKNYPNKADKVL